MSIINIIDINNIIINKVKEFLITFNVVKCIPRILIP